MRRASSSNRKNATLDSCGENSIGWFRVNDDHNPQLVDLIIKNKLRQAGRTSGKRIHPHSEHLTIWLNMQLNLRLLPLSLCFLSELTVPIIFIVPQQRKPIYSTAIAAVRYKFEFGSGSEILKFKMLFPSHFVFAVHLYLVPSLRSSV